MYIPIVEIFHSGSSIVGDNLNRKRKGLIRQLETISLASSYRFDVLRNEKCINSIAKELR